MLSANSYIFRQQGAILSELNNNKASLSPTRNQVLVTLTFTIRAKGLTMSHFQITQVNKPQLILL
jgi:hypothetical protein